MEKFEQIYTEEERKSMIKKQASRIKKVFKNKLTPEIIKLNEGLFEEAATYWLMLDECNALIKRDGVVDYYKNGANQYGTKKSVAAELKPKYTTVYQSLIRQLSSLLPDDAEHDAAVELMEFVNSR